MVLKSNGTSYKAAIPIARRHTRVSVGETYEDRKNAEAKQAAITQSKADDAKNRSIGRKIRDFIFGKSGILRTIDEFVPNAEYVEGRYVAEAHKDIENGIKGASPTDTELFSMLSDVEEKFNASLAAGQKKT